LLFPGDKSCLEWALTCSKKPDRPAGLSGFASRR
jgi:hypothetical protein